MPPSFLARFACAALLVVPAAAATAQSDTAWNKTYPLTGSPSLALEIGDSALSVHACGDCREVRIHVTMEGAKLSQYILTEDQSGNRVHFSFKEKPYIGLHLSWHNSVRVDVETPAQVTLDARTGDGSLHITGLRGSITTQSGDGAQTLEDVAGTLRLRGADGAIRVQRATGTLEARVTDGALDVSGAFTVLNLRSTNGALRVDLAEGSRLNAPSYIHGQDGSVSIHLPHVFPAEIDVETNDGSVHNTLPLAVQNPNSDDSSNHSIHGKLDGGGAPLSIHTTDGSISLTRS